MSNWTEVNQGLAALPGESWKKVTDFSGLTTRSRNFEMGAYGRQEVTVKLAGLP